MKELNINDRTMSYLYDYTLANSIIHTPIEVFLPTERDANDLSRIYLIAKPNMLSREHASFELSEVFADLLNESQLHFITSNAKNILSKNSVRGQLIVHGISSKRSDFYSESKNDLTYVTRMICEVFKWKASRGVAGNIRKSDRSITFTYDKITFNDYLNCLKLVDNANYFHFKLTDLSDKDIVNRWKFISNMNSIAIIAWYNQEIVGWMSGCIINNKSYMLEHYYNPQFVNYYINDGLYNKYISICRGRGVNFVDFGTCLVSDKGLIMMKKKFSTQIKLSANIVIKY